MKREETRLSPWVTLVTKLLERGPGESDEVFHSFVQSDYVAVVAQAPGDEIALIKQFRPALERDSLELPSGLIDAGESPNQAARRELEEEVGLQSQAELQLLGVLNPDSGRLENKLWCFFAGSCVPMNVWSPEEGVEPLRVTPSELGVAIERGSFCHALHIAAIGLAVFAGYLDLKKPSTVRYMDEGTA